MIINMTTIAVRKEHYIHRTLESLAQSDGRDVPVNLILGSSDSSHVDRYRDTLNIVGWGPEAEAQARAGQMRYNCNLNAIRALRYGDDEYCLCCEDDIRFKEDWFSQLMLTIAQIGDGDYVLSLGQGCDQSPDKRYAVHTPRSLVGAQAIFYPSRRLRTAVADYLDENIARGMNDNLVGQYAKRYAALYNTTPMLVGHIGQVSSFSHQPAPPKREAPSRPASEPPMPAPAAGRPAAPPPPAARTAADIARSEARFRVTSEIFLDLLRASLGSGAPLAAARLGECDWQRLTQLATDHRLVPVIHGALGPLDADVPPDWLRRFKTQYVANVFHSQLAQKSVDEIGTAFGKDGISLILLNGVALQRHLYDDPALRVVGEIDLLVDEADVERASERLRGLGLDPIDHGRQHRPMSNFHRVHWQPDAGSVPVDLFWRPFEPYQPYVFDRDAVRAQARPLSPLLPNVLAMSPEHELLHLCLQLDRRALVYRSLILRDDFLELLLRPHGTERLVWLYDIALYVQKRSQVIDWDGLVDSARRWAIDGHAGATLELARRVFAVAPPAEALRALNRSRPRLVDQVAQRLLLAAHRATAMPSASRDDSRRVERLSTHAVRFARGWMALFPSRAYLRARYGGGGTPLAQWALHVRDVVPGLWAETRERLASAAARVR